MIQENQYTKNAIHAFLAIQQYADLQLIRNYLYTVTTSDPKDLTFEDHCYLYHLLVERISVLDQTLYEKLGTREVSSFYKQQQKRLTNLLYDFLSNTYPDDQKEDFYQYSTDQLPISSNFSEEQANFYQSISFFPETKQHSEQKSLQKTY